MLTRAQEPTHASPTHLQPAIGLDDTRERYLHWGTHLRTETVESPTRHTPLSGSHGRDSPYGNHVSPSPMRLRSSGKPRSASTPRGVLRLSQAASPPHKRPFSGVTATANAGGPKHGLASPRPAHSSHRQALQPLSMNTAAIADATNVQTSATKLPQQGVKTGVRHMDAAALPRGGGDRHPHPPSMAAPHAPARQHVLTQNEHTGYGELGARLGSEGQEEEGEETSWQRLKRWAAARNEGQGLGSTKSLGAVVVGGGGAGVPPPVSSASPTPAHNSIVREQGGPGTLGGAVAQVLAAHMHPPSHHIAPLHLAPPSPTSSAGGAWGAAAGAAAPAAAIASGAPTQQDNRPRASVPTAAGGATTTNTTSNNGVGGCGAASGGLTAAAARLQRYQSELAQLDAALTTRASTQHPLGGHNHARALSASHRAHQTVLSSPRPHTSGGAGAGSNAGAMPGCGEAKGYGSVGAVRSSGIESDLLAHYSASLAAAAARSGMDMGALGVGPGGGGRSGDAATHGGSGGGHHYPRAACAPFGSGMGGVGVGGVMSHGGHVQGNGDLGYDAMNLEQAAEALLARARAMAAAPGPKARPAVAEGEGVGMSGGAWDEVWDLPWEEGSGGPPVASSSSAAAEAAVGTAGTAFEGLEGKGDVGEVHATVRRILEGAQLQLMHAQFDARRQELLGAAGLVLAEVQGARGGGGLNCLGVLSEEEVEEARAVAGVRQRLVLLVWRRAVRTRAAAEVRVWMWHCQKR